MHCKNNIHRINIDKSNFLNNPVFRNFYLLITPLLLLLPQLLQAQGGCTGFGSNNTEEAFDIVETNNGAIFVAGRTDQNGGDAYLMKFRHGNFYKEWSKTYGTNNKNEAAKALTLHNGDLYIAGFTKKNGNKDVMLLKLDTATGAVINNKHLGSSNLDEAHDIIITKNGDLAITGRTKTTSAQNSVLTFVMVFTMGNSSFNIKKEFAYGTGNSNHAYNLEQDSKGDYWVVGQESNKSGIGLIYQLDKKFSNNTSSDVIYKAVLNDGANFQSANDIKCDKNKMVITGTGKFQGTSLSAKSAFALKLKANTKNLSNAAKPANKMKEFGSGNTEKARGLSVSSNGYVFIGENGNDEMFSFKAESNLSSVTWGLESGGSSTDIGNAITKIDPGAFLSVGKSESAPYSNGSSNFYLMETYAGSNCCSKSTSVIVKNLNASNLLKDAPANSNFSIDKVEFTNNQGSLSSPITSSVGGTMNNLGACGSLPVEFTSFELEKENPNKVPISWKTASENNNDYFTILRNFEGEVFESVARIEGQGTKTRSTNYSHGDEVPKSGSYYYKIRQTDFDGTQTTSAVKSIYFGNVSNIAIDNVDCDQNGVEVRLSGVRSNHRILTVTGISGKPVGRKKLQKVKGEQTIRFQGQKLKNRMVYIRIVNTLDASTVRDRKVIVTR